MDRKRCSGAGELHRNGFSLVEVLVSVAIIALVCTAVMAGIRSSQKLNHRAYTVSKETACIQKTMEEMKSQEMEKLLADYTVTKNSGKWESLSKEEQKIYPKELFTIYTLEKEEGDYRVEAKLDPNPYSAIGQSESIAKVTDANTFGSPDISQIDSLNNPLISNQIDMYDNAAAEELWLQLPAAVRDSADKGNQLNDIRTKMRKKIQISFSGNSKLSVEGKVNYQSESPDGSTQMEKSYTVYQASFDLVPRLYQDGSFRNWISGGNIYIFATADGGFSENEITINNQYTGVHPLTVSFVRNAYQKEGIYGYNFDRIILKSGAETKTYFDIDNTGTVRPTGIESFSNMRFFSNVRYDDAEVIRRELVQEIKDPAAKPVYETDRKVRCYEATVTLYQVGTDEILGEMTSVREVRS